MSRYQRDSRDSGGSRSSGNHECKVYVGGLGSHFDRRDLEDSFGIFGKLKNVWVARNPPGFAFVEFEDPRDAQDCVKGHKKKICGHEITVEMSNGERRERRYGGGGGGGGGSGRPPLRSASRNDKCYSCGDYGHFARDCPSGRGGGGGGGGRRYSGGGGGGYSRSRRSPSRSRSRSYSPRKRQSRSKSRSKSRSRSRSRSHHRRSSSSDKE